jgi:kinesin family protein C2/C3
MLIPRQPAGDRLDVKQDADGGMFVPGLVTAPVCSMADVSALLVRGSANRSTFATNMNEHSSRSHLVLTVYATSTNLDTCALWAEYAHLL